MMFVDFIFVDFAKILEFIQHYLGGFIFYQPCLPCTVSKPWSDNPHCFQRGYHISCCNWRYSALYKFGFHENVLSCIGKKERKWVYCKHLCSVFRFLCKVNYESENLIHAPTYIYIEVMGLLELASIVECE